jgi:hypothetical protein
MIKKIIVLFYVVDKQILVNTKLKRKQRGQKYKTKLGKVH